MDSVACYAAWPRDQGNKCYSWGVSVEQILTLALALYGAGLSTVLLFVQYRRDRKRVQIFLEYAVLLEQVRLTITNTGLRPVTIIGITVQALSDPDKGLMYDTMPRNALFHPTEAEWPLPTTVGDGEHLTLLLGEGLSERLLENGMKATVSVWDAEGKKHHKHKIRYYNPKWGYYQEGTPRKG